MKNLFTLAFLLNSANLFAQVIDNQRGFDNRVDYETLKNIGPWDDRNYQLTLEDLYWLADDEENIRNLVPAFYRVLFHKEFPNSQNNHFPYPRSLYNRFIIRFGGYLIENELYESARWDENNKRYAISMDRAKSPGKSIRQQIKALSSNTLVFAGAESAVSVSPINADIVVAGLNAAFGGQEMLYSNDGGGTWTSAPDLTGSECCDPTMAWKTDGSFVYNATLGGDNVWFYRSDDNGQTWDSLATETPGNDRRVLVGTGGSLDDKEYMHVDNFPTSPFKDNIYILWDNTGVINFARSTDDGNSFSIQAFNSDPGGIGTDIVTGADGTVYNFWPSPGGSPQIRMNKSTNGGVSFTPSVKVADTLGSFDFPIPSMDSRNVFIYNSADMDLTGGTYNNRLYVSWTDNTGADSNTPASNHARIQVAYSDNGGNSWTVTTPHETNDAATVDRWHQWLKVDKNGTVHVTFYDTRQFADRLGVDTYHSFSTDGAATWSAPQRISDVSSNASSGFQFGDYNGLDFGKTANSGIAIFSDNRTEGGGSNDMDVYVAPVSLIDLIFENGFE